MKLLITLPIFVLLLASCQQTPDEIIIIDPDEQPSGLDCILITDESGASVGTHPAACSPLGQWIQSHLNSEELEILNFPDTVTTPLSPSTTVRRAFAYPNPVSLNQPIHIGFNGISGKVVKVKIAVVNVGNQTIQRQTIVSDRSDIIALNISNSLYDPGAYYRIYFQVLGDKDEVFIEGYGNILICRSATSDIIENCF